jgi:hypothetical protein
MSNAPSAKEVDTFIREGRIGRALVESHNKTFNTEYELGKCIFSVRRQTRGVGKGKLEVVVTFEDGEEIGILIGQLYIFMPNNPRDLTDEEAKFFKRLGFGSR